MVSKDRPLFKTVFEEQNIRTINLQLVYEILEKNGLFDLFQVIKDMVTPVRTFIKNDDSQIEETNYKKICLTTRLPVNIPTNYILKGSGLCYVLNGNKRIWRRSKEKENLFEYTLSKKNQFQDGEFHGKQEEYTYLNFIEEKNYNKGKLHGPQKIFWSYYDKKIKEENYNNGVKDGRWKVYKMETNIICEDGNYVNGKRHGKYRFISESGTYISEVNYAYDRKSGLAMSYNPKNGTIYCENNYKKGHLHGIAKELKNGEVITRKYLNGNLLKQ